MADKQAILQIKDKCRQYIAISTLSLLEKISVNFSLLFDSYALGAEGFKETVIITIYLEFAYNSALSKNKDLSKTSFLTALSAGTGLSIDMYKILKIEWVEGMPPITDILKDTTTKTAIGVASLMINLLHVLYGYSR